MLSDYIPIETDKGNNSLYFLLAESRGDKDIDPLIIWFQGGPGCSSMIGMYTEMGPYNFKYNTGNIKNRGIFTENKFAWNNNAHVMFVDQPLGTGFSFANSIWDYRMTEDQVAVDFYHFLINFYNKYPEFRNRELYLAGESYAGKYIPAIANYLYHTNLKIVRPDGIAIGNGWVDPFYQYESYPIYA